MKRIISLILQLCIVSLTFAQQQQSWIRINQLGYLPESTKVLVWVSKTDTRIKSFEVIDSKTNESIYKGKVNKIFAKYGPFDQGARLDISAVKKSGTYIVKTNDGTSSPVIKINK